MIMFKWIRACGTRIGGHLFWFSGKSKIFREIVRCLCYLGFRIVFLVICGIYVINMILISSEDI